LSIRSRGNRAGDEPSESAAKRSSDRRKGGGGKMTPEVERG